MKSIFFAIFLIFFMGGCAQKNDAEILSKQSLAQKYKLEILESNCINLKDVLSCGKAGESAEKLGLINKAVQFYTIACEKNNIDYCIKLGNLYEKGHKDFKKNPSKAIQIYDKACKQNHKSGCKAAGNFFYDRYAYESALEYYNKACMFGEMSACFKMAKMFENGIGVPKDKNLARQIYTTICFRGDDSGCSKMEELK